MGWACLGGPSGAFEGQADRWPVPQSIGPIIRWTWALDADERGAGGERQSEEERDGDRAAVEQALECGKLCERHDKVPLVRFDPLGEQGMSDLDGA